MKQNKAAVQTRIADMSAYLSPAEPAIRFRALQIFNQFKENILKRDAQRQTLELFTDARLPPEAVNFQPEALKNHGEA